MAIKQNFLMFSGNDVTLDVELIDEVTEVPLILTGVQGFTWSAARRGERVALVEKTLGTGISVMDEANGRVNIIIDSDDTEDMEGVYYHELRMTNSAGKKITLMYGAVEVAINLVSE